MAGHGTEVACGFSSLVCAKEKQISLTFRTAKMTIMCNYTNADDAGTGT